LLKTPTAHAPKAKEEHSAVYPESKAQATRAFDREETRMAAEEVSHPGSTPLI
jgi:hypothetical protein